MAYVIDENCVACGTAKQVALLTLSQKAISTKSTLILASAAVLAQKTALQELFLKHNSLF